MNIIGKPDVWSNPLQNWFDKNLAEFIDQKPEIGDLRIEWFVSEAMAEEDGEIVTVERWNGEGWEQFGLDAHDTVQDLFDLEWKLGNLCDVCGQEIQANCNNAGCDDGFIQYWS